MPDARELFHDQEEAFRAAWAGVRSHMFTSLPAVVAEDSDGQPIQTPQGVLAQCLINPAIVVDSSVTIASSSIIAPNIQNSTLRTEDAQRATDLANQGVMDGLFRVLHIDTQGDTRGGPWLMNLTCIGSFTGAPNAVQAGLGYV